MFMREIRTQAFVVDGFVFLERVSAETFEAFSASVNSNIFGSVEAKRELKERVAKSWGGVPEGR